ncbi:hypothetical protein GIB67_002893 [Kingdonia uniflora]|uniref:MI domain-containing protein n=1 Tax=Kingdonia uniflora TaxID=39325 RepID=A0A7J7P518_9MAGN|nr:hypothetical protein GIB67_002893 [Kingdonia uniflora]
MDLQNQEERTEKVEPVPESGDQISLAPLLISVYKSPRAQKSPYKYGSPFKSRNGGKGTWGGLLDTGNDVLDPNDPNYDNNELKECDLEEAFRKYKKKVTIIVEEYFATDAVESTVNELRELGMPSFNYYFVKKLFSMAMDRHDKEKEMAAVLLSNVLASFISRAMVNDILPPAFLMKEMDLLPEDSIGVEVMNRAEKGYLTAPLHAEINECKWGGSKNKTVDVMKARINNLLREYVVSGDKMEAFRCIKDLNVPFFHHEIVKGALIMAMEKRASEGRLLDFLKDVAEEGIINLSQITKGFGRLNDNVEDLSLNILSAKELLQSLIYKAASEGWLCASSLKSFSFQQEKHLEDNAARLFKIKIQPIIQEYFLSGDILEVISSLNLDNNTSFSFELSA